MTHSVDRPPRMLMAYFSRAGDTPRTTSKATTDIDTVLRAYLESLIPRFAELAREAPAAVPEERVNSR